MPLRDHFHPPLERKRHWEGFHGQWPAVMVQYLGEQLPPRYFAEPRVHIGSRVEIDVASFREEEVRLELEETYEETCRMLRIS
jgi:hypothetical protein